MTWERLIELLDNRYYPRDVQRMKEREFLSLKQGHLSVMEYAAQFNELSRFSLHQVSTKERRMDHFEQGLRGDIKSVIAGQTFANFQDMYQRAVKVARVMEENKKETQVLNLERRQREFSRQGFLSQGDKRFRPNFSPGKGKQPMIRPPNYPTYRICDKNHSRRCLYGNLYCYECGQRGHKRSECPTIIGSQNRAIPSTEPPRPPLALPRLPFVASRGRPPVWKKEMEILML